MDFEKAFDKVPHRRLISKLHSYGVNSNIISWITNFLDKRLFRVVVNGIYSSWHDVISRINICSTQLLNSETDRGVRGHPYNAMFLQQ